MVLNLVKHYCFSLISTFVFQGSRGPLGKPGEVGESGAEVRPFNFFDKMFPVNR